MLQLSSKITSKDIFLVEAATFHKAFGQKYSHSGRPANLVTCGKSDEDAFYSVMNGWVHLVAISKKNHFNPSCRPWTGTICW